MVQPRFCCERPAVVLNAASPRVWTIPSRTAEIISDVNAALATDYRSTMLSLAAALDAYNNLGCTIDATATRSPWPRDDHHAQRPELVALNAFDQAIEAEGEMDFFEPVLDPPIIPVFGKKEDAIVCVR